MLLTLLTEVTRNYVEFLRMANLYANVWWVGEKADMEECFAMITGGRAK